MVDIYTTTANDTLTLEELALYRMIMDYRAANGLPDIPLSQAMTITAGRHAVDSYYNIFKAGVTLPYGTSMHSWSDAYYYTDGSTNSVMWGAPQRLGTGYPANGYEISAQNYLSSAAALTAWQGSPVHNNLMVNLDHWSDDTWNAIGVGIEAHPDQYFYHVWFGKVADPTGPPLIAGTLAAETVTGTRHADRIDAGGGNDTLIGGGSADELSGAAGNDVLAGDGLTVAHLGAVTGQVYRLYRATLDRDPDAAGFADWVQTLDSGAATLAQVVTGFVQSAEFQAVYGPQDDTGFVTLLYRNVLNRAPDDAGLADWTGRLASGTSREAVVLGFSESAEFIAGTQGQAAAYAQSTLPSAWSDDVFRLYQSTLGRAPDLAGLLDWTQKLADGRAFSQVVTGFVASVEFANTYGALDDTGFVTLLYNNVLNRAPDPAGLADWTGRLASGTSRETVVQGFSQSAEFVAATAGALKDWMRGQGTDDVLAGGGGDNTVLGGILADRFVFDPAAGGTHHLHDLEPWDWMVLDGFGYADAAAARAALSQSGENVVFADQGVTIVVHGITLSQIADDMIEV